MPLFSLCVTVYNLEKYIGKCLGSILTQDFDDYELIVADNGSVDRSVEICESWQRRYPDKMKFIKLPPPTIFGRSALAAYGKASGVYIHPIDGDDYVGEGYLKNLAEIIKEKKPDLIMGSFTGISEDGEVAFNDVDICAEKINNVSHYEALEYIFSLPYLNKCLWRFVVKNSIFGFDNLSKSKSWKIQEGIKTLPEVSDTLCTIGWLFSAKSMVYYSGPFYYYRRRGGSITSFRNNTVTIEYFQLALLYQARINQMKRSNAQYSKLLLPDLIWYCKLVAADYDLITYDGLLQMDQTITGREKVFHSLAKHDNEMLKRLVALVKKYGNMEGLVMFFEWERIRFAARLKDVRDHEIYVFPTGRFGEGTARLLRDRGFHVKGFLDNDRTKSGVEFQGIPCYLPEHMRSLAPQEKDKTVVVIATIYEKLFPVLKKQLIDDGIDEERIFVRD